MVTRECPYDVIKDHNVWFSRLLKGIMCKRVRYLKDIPMFIVCRRVFEDWIALAHANERWGSILQIFKQLAPEHRGRVIATYSSEPKLILYLIQTQCSIKLSTNVTKEVLNRITDIISGSESHKIRKYYAEMILTKGFLKS